MGSLDLQALLSEVVDHVRGMWRYRWWANSIAWVVFLAGAVFVSLIPDVYRASTRVFVDTNSLLKPLMRGLTVADNVLDEVQLFSRVVLTRPNLEKVAQKTDLALRAKTPEAFEALIADLQRRVIVTGGRDNVFSIQYEDANREKAVAVVTALLDTFVESSIGTQDSDTDATERAVANEIKIHEARLRESEETLAKFKQSNLGYMPGEYGDYYKRLQAALANVNQTEEKVRLLSERRDALKREIAGEDPVVGLVVAPARAASPTCPQSGQIAQLKNELAELRVQFTDKHPRVVTLQDTIVHLEEECGASAPQRSEQAFDSAGPRPTESLDANIVYQNLKLQLSTAEVDLAELRAQLESGQKTVAELRRDVDKITEVEAQLKQLNRDYDVVQARHQELLKRWEDLMATKRLDPVAGNVKFQRIEPPFAAMDPVGPRRPMLLAGVLLLALGFGLAVAFAANQLHPVFFTRAALGKAANVPILGSITMILSPSAVARRRNEAIAWGGAYVVLILFCAVTVLFASRLSTLLQALTGGHAT